MTKKRLLELLSIYSDDATILIEYDQYEEPTPIVSIEFIPYYKSDEEAETIILK